MNNGDLEATNDYRQALLDRIKEINALVAQAEEREAMVERLRASVRSFFPEGWPAEEIERDENLQPGDLGEGGA